MNLLSQVIKKNQGLAAIAKAVREHKDNIIEANALDIEAYLKQNGMSESLLDRLTLTSERIEGMAKVWREVLLKDPIGTVLDGMVQSNGLKIEKVRVPLGVIGMIYEARPNLTSDAAALCLKSGNAVILRGGKRSIPLNQCITNIMQSCIRASRFVRKLCPACAEYQ